MGLTDQSLTYAGTFKQLVSNKALLYDLDASEFPDVNIMPNGDVFINTKKVTDEKGNSSITLFVIMDRRLQPVMGFNGNQLNISDGLIMMAFRRSLNSNTSIGLGNFIQTPFNNANASTNIENFLYCIPLNEVVLSKSYIYNVNGFNGNNTYDKNNNMFIVTTKIKTISSDYWNYDGNKTEISDKNKAWFEEYSPRINSLIGGLGMKGSEMEYILSSMRN